MRKFENPVADWPRTRPLTGGGIHISGSYVHPRLAGAAPRLYGFIVFVQCAMVCAGTGNIVAAAVWGALMALLYPLLWKQALSNLLGKIVDISVLPDRLELRQGFFRKSYSRGHPIAFRIEPHSRGFDEIAREMKTGRAQARTYRLAVEVVMQYGERRVAIAELPLAEIGHAEALLARLQDAMEDTRPAAAISVAGRSHSYSPYSSAAHLYG